VNHPNGRERAPGERPTVALVGPRPDTHGGVAAMLRILADSDLSNRYRVVVVSTYRDGSRVQKAVQALVGLVRLTLLSFRGKLDLVHLHSSWGASFTRKAVALAIVKAARRPVVLHLHGGRFEYELVRPGPWGFLRRRAIRWALTTADVVVALTPGWAEKLGDLARIRRLRVVPNAPEFVSQPMRNEPVGPPTIVYLGHLYRAKGVFELVEAFAALRSEHPDLRLVLAGDGSETDELQAHALARGLGPDAVELPGWIGPERKLQLLSSACCFVLPSYHEGLPLAMLEAMTCGVPVVATPVGGIPEVVTDEVDALLVPPRDSQALAGALARVLNDRALAARLSDGGRRRALEDYSPAAIVKRVDAIYSELLEGPTP
jgi:glycosyltransferase involved in cell wall biosynthesis